MKEKKYDAMIVGQGLAGTVLAWQYLLKKKRVLVIDNDHASAASFAAIGIYNPLIIKRIKKSWRALELINFAREFFTSIETELDCTIWSEKPIHRIFSNKEENRLWEEKCALEAWKDYIGISKLSIKNITHDTGIVRNTGWLNIPEFILKSQEYFKNNNSFFTSTFDHSGLEIKSGTFSYKDLRSKKIFFCEGYKLTENPFFQGLPLNPAKGEILTIRDPGLKLEEILKTAFFIAPIGNDLYKIGATFEWDELNERASEKARTEILDKIKRYTSDGLEVIDQIAGVRPAVQDRRPLIGEHLDHKGMYLFNGMGTRGVMLAPFFAQELLSHVYEGEPLSPEVDIARFN